MLDAVEAHTELVTFAEAPADIHGPPHLAVGGIAAGERGNRLVASALGLHVDATAYAAPGRYAVEQLAGAFDDVDPLGHFHVDRIGRQDPVQAVVGDITIEQAEAANGELFEAPAGGVGGAYRGVAGNQLAQGAGLLVLDHLAGVTGDAEGGFHEVPRAEQALCALACHLAASIGLRLARGDQPADDTGRGDFQGATGLGGRHQGEGPFTHREPLQAAATQQLGKPFVNTVGARQASALPALHQCRVQRKADARLVGEAGQRGPQAGGRYLVCAAHGLIGPGR